MKRGLNFLLVICLAAVAGVFVLQFFWVRNYYYVNKEEFSKQANMAFEDAIKKEFELRCDTIEALIVKKLMDTAEFSISSRLNPKYKRYEYIVSNKHNIKDSFSFDSLTSPVTQMDTAFKKKVAIRFAKTLREEDLQNHFIFYRTQNLGAFMAEQANKYAFDTVRLRPVLTRYLKERDINAPFVLSLRNTDSTVNRSNFNAELLSKYPVITKAFPTYKLQADQHFVRAMFINPFSYIISKMGLMFAGSLLLIITVAFSLFYLFKMLLNEKKLAIIKNDFINNITHELKTPIATVSAAVESLSDFDVLSDEEKTRRYLDHSKSELRRLSGLVDKVLNTTIYENKNFVINPEKLEVDDVILGVIDNYKIGTGKLVSIFYKNESGIQFIKADKLNFQQVISNGIDNCIKYSGDEVTINIDCKADKHFFVISIQDNGIGILKENIPYLFEKFYRVPTGNTHQVKGHGLGLNYVKNIIERHNGWCQMESEYGKGSKLILNWPV
ncbi:MAG TPA: HAMP domain-containing sensor histidine kinase [Mucilaginibacter sp.]|nr:HAMP domain-containing sensor histidine kinase [Mucilaginibacter sp.]